MTLWHQRRYNVAYWLYEIVTLHDSTMLCHNISDIVIMTVKDIDYRCIIHDISKSDAIHMLENYVLDDRGYM